MYRQCECDMWTHKLSTRILELNFPGDTFFLKNSDKEWKYLITVFKSKLSYKSKQLLILTFGEVLMEGY